MSTCTASAFFHESSARGGFLRLFPFRQPKRAEKCNIFPQSLIFFGEGGKTLMTENFDCEIVQLLFQRDEKGIALGKKQYDRRLLSFVRTLLGSDVDAEEILNDVWFHAWNSIPPNRPDSYLPAYLLSLARRAAINRLKYRTREKRNFPIADISEELDACVPDSADTESESERRELMKRINAFLCSVPPTVRIMFVRRYFFCESEKAIAEQLGMSYEAVRTGLSRTRKRLKSYLEMGGIIV